MYNNDTDRKPSADWREYLFETYEAFRVCAWVWRELTAPAARVIARRMLAYSVLMMVFSMAGPWLISHVVDGAMDRDATVVIWATGGVAAAWILTRIFAWLYMLDRETVQGENFIAAETRLTGLFLEKSLGQHLSEGSSLNAANIEKGRAKVFEVQDMLLFFGLETVLRVFVTFIFVWFFSPVVGVVMTALLGWYLVTMVFLNRRCEVACTPLDTRFRAANRRRCERWEKVERVKTAAKEEEERDGLNADLVSVVGDERKFWHWFIHAITVRGLADIITGVGVMVYGVWMVWQGDWTVGLLYPAIIYSRQMSDNLAGLGQIEHRLNWSLPAIRSMMKALTVEPEIVDRPDAVDLVPNASFRVAFENVTCVYRSPKSDGQEAKRQPVLSGVSFSIEPGEKAAFIGASGAGKTTVARLIQRYMDPFAGRVAVDGVDLRDIRLARWLERVAYVPQQPQVFDGTIRSNLVYGLSPEAAAAVTDDELWTLMRQLRIDFGPRLTEGLETKVGRNGLRLSGGEAQRLMIGAAVIRRPRFMVIDEATASLDSTNEKLVQQGLAEALKGGVGAVVIAHRLSTVRHLCTKFIVMNGVGEGRGAHVEAVASSFEELYRISPTFRRLADDQDIVIDQRRSQPSS